MDTQQHQPSDDKAAELAAPADKATPVYRQKFVWMIVLAMVLATLFTIVALRLYNTSMAAQLDLSRPGFEQVRAGVDQTEVAAFESTGAITEETVTEFQELYNEEYAKTKTNQYSSDTLTDEALGMTTLPTDDN